MVFTIHISKIFLYMTLSQMLTLAVEHRLSIQKHFQASSKAFFVTMKYVLVHQVLFLLQIYLFKCC